MLLTGVHRQQRNNTKEVMHTNSILRSLRSIALAGGAALLACQAFAGGFTLNPNFNRAGNILISDQFNNRVIEADSSGNIIWQFGVGPNDFTATSPIGVNDAQRVGFFTLVAGTGIPGGVIPGDPDGTADNRVMLVDPFKRIVWQYGQFGVSGSGPNQLNTPVQCTWLPNFHVLITDQANNRIIEVTLAKKIVWEFPGSSTDPNAALTSPNSAELLENGNILIADEGASPARVIEVNRAGQILHTFTAGGTLGAVAFASRLDNGDTLMTDAGNSRAVEVDANDNVVWQYFTNDPNGVGAPLPTRAVRLRNGDTLISDQFNNRVIQVDAAGQIVNSWGLALDGTTLAGTGGAIAGNVGFDLHSTQKGLFSPYDAKIVGDYTGLTPPFDFDRDADDAQ